MDVAALGSHCIRVIVCVCFIARRIYEVTDILGMQLKLLLPPSNPFRPLSEGIDGMVEGSNPPQHIYYKDISTGSQSPYFFLACSNSRF